MAEDAAAAARTLFDLVDKDGSGTISRKELRKALRSNKDVNRLCRETPSLNALLKPTTFRRAFNAIDVDGSGEVDFEELKALCITATTGKKPEEEKKPEEPKKKKKKKKKRTGPIDPLGLAKARNEGIRFGSTLSGFGYRFRVEPNANVAAIRREKLAAHLLMPSQAGCPAPLHTAAYHGDAEEVLRHLAEDCGQDVNDRVMVYPQETALHEAGSGGGTEAARALIAAGADVKATDDNGCTPLHRACRNGSVGVMRALVEAGAALKPRDCRGRTPFELALMWGYEDAVVESGVFPEEVETLSATRQTTRVKSKFAKLHKKVGRGAGFFGKSHRNVVQKRAEADEQRARDELEAHAKARMTIR